MYQFRDFLRARRFLLMLVLVLLIGGIFTALVAHYRPAGLLSDSVSFYQALWGIGASVVVVFAGVIFGGDAIAGEFQNRTGYFLMGLPIRRVTVYAGKYIAAFLASVLSLALFAAILIANGVVYFGDSALPEPLLWSFLLAVGYLLALLGTTFLFSSMFKTSLYATLVVAVLFLFGFSILETAITGLTGSEPWYVITYAATSIGNVFSNPYPPHVVPSPFGSGNSYVATLPEAVAIMIGYFLFTTLLGLLLFEREEFT